MFKLIPDREKEEILLWLLILCSMIRVVRSTAAGDFLTFVCLMALTTLFFDHKSTGLWMAQDMWLP